MDFLLQGDVFWFKNGRETFQRTMDKAFESQIGRNVEIYADDILVHSVNPNNHAADLEETFNNLRKTEIMLKAKKCAFGVTEGQFLGYLITLKAYSRIRRR